MLNKTKHVTKDTVRVRCDRTLFIHTVAFALSLSLSSRLLRSHFLTLTLTLMGSHLHVEQNSLLLFTSQMLRADTMMLVLCHLDTN